MKCYCIRMEHTEWDWDTFVEPNLLTQGKKWVKARSAQMANNERCERVERDAALSLTWWKTGSFHCKYTCRQNHKKHSRGEDGWLLHRALNKMTPLQCKRILTRVTETLKINSNAIVNKLMLFSCLKHSYLVKKKGERNNCDYLNSLGYNKYNIINRASYNGGVNV